jgi:NDP-sugar pyrophosphorylase family protein
MGGRSRRDADHVQSGTGSSVPSLQDIHVVLQAGGRGSRLHSETKHLPKPMVSVGGIPLVERLLRQFVEAGSRNVTIVTGWQGHVIENHVDTLSDLPGDLRIEFLREVVPRGNVGSLAEVEIGNRLGLLSFADIITDLDFGGLARAHKAVGADVTLAAHWVSHRLPYGELLTEGNLVSGYVEKPEKRFLVCSGIAVFDHQLTTLLGSCTGAVGIFDLIPRAIVAGLKVAYWSHNARWIDVNSSQDIERANEVFGK